MLRRTNSAALYHAIPIPGICDSSALMGMGIS
jgi:hypothetical protein